MLLRLFIRLDFVTICLVVLIDYIIIILGGLKMARKKKKITLEEEILELELEAEDCEEEIKRLNDREQELKQLIEQKQLEALRQAMLRSGKSIEEVISLIDSDGQAET